MVGGVAGKFQAEVCLHRRADVRRPAGVNAPAAVFVLMLQNVVRGLLKARRIAGAE